MQSLCVRANLIPYKHNGSLKKGGDLKTRLIISRPGHTLGVKLQRQFVVRSYKEQDVEKQVEKETPQNGGTEQEIPVIDEQKEQAKVEEKEEMKVVEEAPTKAETKVQEKTEKVVSELKEVGFDQKQARAVLKKWQESGAETPEQLRKLFIKGSYAPFLGIGLQILLDVGAAYGGLAAAVSISSLGFPGSFLLGLLFYFLSAYFAVGVFFDLFTLGALIAGAVTFGTNTQAFYSAVKQIAGETGLSVIDKAKASVNIARITQVLNSMAEILRAKTMQSGQYSTLENLGAYLTLIKAKENYGFKSEDYNVSDEQAGEIAAVFAKYDVNDDYRLELSELRNLVSDLGKELNEDELAAAIKILDKRNSGFVEFDEFVNWWVNEVKVEEVGEESPVTKS